MINNKIINESEYKLLLSLIENQYIGTLEQLDYFKECFEIDDLEENLIFIKNTKDNIKRMMIHTIILTRALRDKLENG